MDPCGVCNGTLVFMGTLGNLNWFRCRNCGKEHSFTRDELLDMGIDLDEEEEE